MKDTATFGAVRRAVVSVPTIVQLTDNSTTVHTGRCYLHGIYVDSAMSAHDCLVSDDTTTIITLPASTAAGNYWEFHGARFNTSLVIDPNDAATGRIVVFWWPEER